MTEVFIEMGIGDEEQNTGAATGVAVASTTNQDQSSTVRPSRIDVGGVNIDTVFGREEVNTAMRGGSSQDLTHWNRQDQLVKPKVVGAIVPLTDDEKNELEERVNRCRHEVSSVQRSDPLAKRPGEA